MNKGRLALGLASLTLSCAGEEARSLEGSLSVLMDFTYEHASIEQSPDAIAIRFAKKKGTGEDTVFKVTASLAGTALVAHATFDLAELLHDGTQRGVPSRDVLGDPRHAFPKLRSGYWTLERLPATGESTNGELSVTFENGTELASGRTVYGNYEAMVP